MLHFKYRLFLTMFGLLTCFTLSSCWKRELKIGLAMPLSGASTPRGQEILNAVLLAIEETNQKGGVKGHPLELITQDDQDSAQLAPKSAETLVQKGVVGVIGHYSSDASLAALSTYIAAGIPLISPSVSLSNMPSEGRIFFRTGGHNLQQAQTAAEFIHASGFKRIAIVRNRSVYAKELAGHLESALKHYADTQAFQYQDEAELWNSFQLFQPELVFYAGGYQDASQFLLHMRDHNSYAQFMGGHTLEDDEFIRIAGVQQVKGSWVLSRHQGEAEFIQKYQQRFGRPGPYSASAFEATQLLIKALETSPDFEPEDIQDALAKLQKQQKQAPFYISEISDKGQFQPAPVLTQAYAQSGSRLGAKARLAAPATKIKLKKPSPLKKP